MPDAIPRRRFLQYGALLGATLVAGSACSGSSGSSSNEGLALIDWNAPKSMRNRLMGRGQPRPLPKEYVDKVKAAGGTDITGSWGMLDGYVLPKGWQAATEGVKELTIVNAGSLEGDPATALGGVLFEEMTGIKLDWDLLSCDTAPPKETTVFSSQSGSIPIPQVCSVYLDAPQWGQSGWLQSVDFLWPSEIRQLYAKGLPDIYRAPNGHFYGAPGVAMHTFFLYYRPSWLKGAGVEVPRTWQELIVASAKVKQWAKANVNDQATGLVMPALEPTVLAELWGHPTYAKGQTIMQGKRAVIDPEVWQLLVDLMTKGGMEPGVFSDGWDAPAQAFGQGTTGFAVDFDVYLGQFGQAGSTQAGSSSSALGDDWEAAPLPAWEGVNVPGRGQIRVDSWLVNAFASPQERAVGVLWLDFYRSYQQAFNEFVTEGNEPVVTAVYKDPAAKHSPIVIPKYSAMEAQALQRQRLETFPPQMPNALNSFKEFLSKAVLEGLDPTEARKSAQSAIDEALSV